MKIYRYWASSHSTSMASKSYFSHSYFTHHKWSNVKRNGVMASRYNGSLLSFAIAKIRIWFSLESRCLWLMPDWTFHFSICTENVVSFTKRKFFHKMHLDCTKLIKHSLSYLFFLSSIFCGLHRSSHCGRKIYQKFGWNYSN